MKIEMPDKTGKVLSIEISPKYRLGKRESCEHWDITADPELAEVECNDCRQKVNAVIWITRCAEKWDSVISLSERYERAAAIYDEKTRCKCDHCGQMTHINPPSQFDRKMREKESKRRQ